MLASAVRAMPVRPVGHGAAFLACLYKENAAVIRSFASSAALPEVDSDELLKQLEAKTPGILVLDVRSPEELAAGTIKGSFNVPTPVFKQADTGPLDKAIHGRIKDAKEVVVHCLFCSPGKRGPTAAAALRQRLQTLGISPAPRVSVLTGGIDAFMKKHGGRTDIVSLPAGGWKVEAH